jgi:hypothetical protein
MKRAACQDVATESRMLPRVLPCPSPDPRFWWAILPLFASDVESSPQLAGMSWKAMSNCVKSATAARYR